MKVYRDKGLHAFLGFGLMAVVLALGVLNPWIWALTLGVLAVPIGWEYYTKGDIYSDGAKDIAATYAGSAAAIAIFIFVVLRLPT